LSRHEIYDLIVKAVKEKKMKEPFTEMDFRITCKGFSEPTYRSFLHNHEKNNRAGHTKYFQRVKPGKFRLIRPLKYNQ
jgi:hypothetical protein